MYEQFMHDLNTHNQDFLQNAIEVVLAWNLSDEGFSQAVSAQACLMAGGIAEETEMGLFCHSEMHNFN